MILGVFCQIFVQNYQEMKWRKEIYLLSCLSLCFVVWANNIIFCNLILLTDIDKRKATTDYVYIQEVFKLKM